MVLVNSSQQLFRNKVVIVTGGASGIGQALCWELGHRGAQLIVLDINEAGCQQVASDIVQDGGQAQGFALDVSDAKQFQRRVEQVVADYGRLDYIFNNAGLAIAGDFRELSLDHWHRLVDVNLWGVVYGTKAAYQIMAQQGFGHIVNISSLGGLMDSPMLTPYAATKHAVVGLSTSLRTEAEDLGVKVSVVCPNYVQTAIYDHAVIVGINKDNLLGELPFKLMDASDAAREILRGVSRNEGIIVFPAIAKILWWLYRIYPPLIKLLITRKIARGFRILVAKEQENKAAQAAREQIRM